MAADGSVVFGSYDSHVYKLSSSGKLIWKVKTLGNIYAPATISPDGAVLIGTELGSFYKLSLATGEVLWRFKNSLLPMNSGAALGEGQYSDIIVMRSYDKNVYGISYSTGKLLWTFKTGDDE